MSPSLVKPSPGPVAMPPTAERLICRAQVSDLGWRTLYRRGLVSADGGSTPEPGSLIRIQRS